MQKVKYVYHCDIGHEPIQIETDELYPKCPKCLEQGIEQIMAFGRYFYRE